MSSGYQGKFARLEKPVVKTQAEFDALTVETRLPNTVYHVVNVGGSFNTVLTDSESGVINEAETVALSFLSEDGNQDANFTALEAVISGSKVNLAGKTFEVSKFPSGNFYEDAIFIKEGRYFSSKVIYELDGRNCVYKEFGNGFSALRRALGRPLNQKVGINLLGDSKTWNATLAQNSVSTPRDGTLSDPRDNATSPSWVNNLKYFIGQNYGRGSAPSHSATNNAPSGENLTSYTFEDVEFVPSSDDGLTGEVTYTITGPSTGRVLPDLYSDNYKIGARSRFDIGSEAASVDITFNFTGDKFDFHYFSQANVCAKYELIVDGVSKGTFKTSVNSASNPSDNRDTDGVESRTHAFDHVNNKQIIIRASKDEAGDVGVHRFYVFGLVMQREIKINNQGINGQQAQKYADWCVKPNGFGDGQAVSNETNFVFVSFGENDEGYVGDRASGISGFKKDYNYLLDLVEANTESAEIINIASSRTLDDNRGGTSFELETLDIRNAIRSISETRAMDFVDFYAVTNNVNADINLHADNLHDGILGHAVCTQCIVGALEGF